MSVETNVAPHRLSHIGVLHSLSIVSEANQSALEETPEKKPAMGAEAYARQSRPSNLATYGTSGKASKYR